VKKELAHVLNLEKQHGLLPMKESHVHQFKMDNGYRLEHVLVGTGTGLHLGVQPVAVPTFRTFAY
jgi:hypothetical protein